MKYSSLDLIQKSEVLKGLRTLPFCPIKMSEVIEECNPYVSFHSNVGAHYIPYFTEMKEILDKLFASVSHK